MVEAPAMTTHYDLLGVTPDASGEDLKRAYRQKALLEHPDKGGDDARFHEIAKAYSVLEDPQKREAYDEELQRARERALLVEGAPAAGQSAFVAARVKTEPTPGSKRSSKTQAKTTGRQVMKMIRDDATPEATAEALFTKYSALPRDKTARRNWAKSLQGEEKQNLKACAKEHEKAQRAKWAQWLNR
eukprot:TRINITY_DN9834_c0_g1_i1.p1 TRINITY_DN9834_c0_g1~~TRINITY_DN9834_c0_g1_i1.p1  ORF type:complete len:187 (+),score=41.94 TRINITY_DN9834_c0_g1_i1:120-680(+)